MTTDELKELLEALYEKYNSPAFIADDPISVPHRFSSRQDIEIAGFLSATIAWGNRRSIVRNADRMVELMDNAPYDFIVNYTEGDLSRLSSFVHRTFNGIDFIGFIRSLRQFYFDYGGLGGFFEEGYAASGDLRVVLSEFRTRFFCGEHELRTEKHLSSIDKGAACKRLNMYLKWMVRRDDRGVDFGLWDKIPASALYLPLDVHTATVGRELGLLTRRQNDWKAVEEVTESLRQFDKDDPVKYDFALFGAGVSRSRTEHSEFTD